MPLKTQLRAKHGQVFRLGQVVNLLQMSSAELTEHLAAQAQENPVLVLRQRRAASMSATDVLEMTAVEQANSLYDHVFQELAGLIGQGGLMEKVITALVAELEPSGWLGRPVDAIAESLDLSVMLVETALQVVQKRIDPPGLFARNLQECLRLQLEERETMTADMDVVLAHLSELESGGTAALVRATGLSGDAVQDCLVLLRQLDPKPGTAFVSDPTLTREPDVRVSLSDDRLEIEYLAAWQGDVEIIDLPRSGRASEATEALAQARSLQHALKARASAQKQVVGQIVERQGAYFRFGDQALVPMTLSEIAQETGFHLSTVSRVLNGLLIEGPNGIVLARTLFSGTASVRGTQSKPQVQARIRALLAEEDSKKPLSDRRLTAILQSEGIAISRRVVSNYRQDIGIHPAAKRRQRA
ncbi:RNA polymerase factor sigma-54 [Phaeobacter gallaeciensis]|uniref:RNA polymerase sigma-54 factor n=1 Tax=Phaeobacter gallaeciensis TaxID=60890 RepID=A0AAC9Z8J0_9RHOB|nr:helix-turn-helix domain-containing protein [Phaeobacter gallaeciensis]AHD09167.1 RNA polymerase, sigma 54 subunit, RpoN/SigL [Phaeobacter gallaeciensis DSM 26640]ATE92430.1 RNA polymerase, sigma 54 subunit, RpoN/SigL [Phaeobacter gallaeciensis]ATE97748.1 RNA polymerase, sigma 54 subunit, RpoN/SigL [Phaeobacter gallaeciensis]ATF01095.1 RNA polymerase, sigma 54 subunit, RpoN/SigL [Phaeobacter gallaeciensis]ATF05475.1 RNA polymerase, sigma 54 subunit, RpoN/SigL [Phaeobacter gallaeciensis]